MYGSSLLRRARKQQSNVEKRPPQTANEPPSRRALAFTASTAPPKRSPRGAFRAPLNEWNMVPPTWVDMKTKRTRTHQRTYRHAVRHGQDWRQEMWVAPDKQRPLLVGSLSAELVGAAPSHGHVERGATTSCCAACHEASTARKRRGTAHRTPHNARVSVRRGALTAPKAKAPPRSSMMRCGHGSRS